MGLQRRPPKVKYFTPLLLLERCSTWGGGSGRTDGVWARARLTLRELKRNSASFIGRPLIYPILRAAGLTEKRSNLRLWIAEYNPPFFPGLLYNPVARMCACVIF